MSSTFTQSCLNVFGTITLSIAAPLALWHSFKYGITDVKANRTIFNSSTYTTKLKEGEVIEDVWITGKFDAEESKLKTLLHTYHVSVNHTGILTMGDYSKREMSFLCDLTQTEAGKYFVTLKETSLDNPHYVIAENRLLAKRHKRMVTALCYLIGGAAAAFGIQHLLKHSSSN